MDKSEVRKREIQNNVLLVEGENDKHVVWSLLKYHAVPQHFEVVDRNGIENLLEAFEGELTRVVDGKVGVIIDADTNLTSRWESLHHILAISGYTSIPLYPISNGTILRQERKPVVGIWLMPDNTIPGMLEDFVAFLRPQKDLLWPMVDEAVLKVKTLEEEHRFRDVHESKARIHTWLSWQKEPGKPMGQAITARYLDADAPYALKLISWIRALFDLESA